MTTEERKKYILEYVYQEYQNEINRKSKIEDKAIGYYTILGISFAGFLVLFVYIISNNIFITQSIIGFLNILFLFLSPLYLIILIFSISFLHKIYSPAERGQIVINAYWEMLENPVCDNDESLLTSIYENLEKCINKNEVKNNKNVDLLVFVDIFMRCSIMINILFVFIILLKLVLNF